MSDQSEWVMVPREPTEEMTYACRYVLSGDRWGNIAAPIYRAMLAAAPPAPAAEPVAWAAIGRDGRWNTLLPEAPSDWLRKAAPEIRYRPLVFGDTAPPPVAKEAEPKPSLDDVRKRFHDPAFIRWLEEGISDCGHTVFDTIENVADAWAAWSAKDYYAAPAAEPVAILTNPHTGTPRDWRDVESDPEGKLIVAAGAPLIATPPPVAKAAEPFGWVMTEGPVQLFSRTKPDSLVNRWVQVWDAPPPVEASQQQASAEEAEPVSCRDDDGCPQELAVLKREWRRLTAELKDAQQSRDWHARRCDLLQQWQSRMRDPERTIVCDILANGATLPDPNGTRYGIPEASQQQASGGVAELAAWLRENSSGIYRKCATAADLLEAITAERDALQVEIFQFTFDLEVLKSDIESFQKTNDALAAEAEALRKDAERYRFVRSCDYEQDRKLHSAQYTELLLGERLDAAIDAAIAAQGSQRSENRNEGDAP